MNLRALRVVVGIMDEGTLTQAARRMNLSQSAASRLLSLLEEDLGVPLFVRDRRTLIATGHAEALYPEARRILAQVAALPDIVRGDGPAPLRIVCQTRLMAGLAVPAVARLAHARPDITIHLEAAPRRHLLRRVASGRHDLAVATLPLPSHSKPSVHLGAVPLGILIARGHPLASAAALDVEDLAGVPYIALDETTVIRRIVDDMSASAGTTLRPAYQTSTGAAAYQLVADGLGFTFADRIAVDPNTALRTVLVPWRRHVEVGMGLFYLNGEGEAAALVADQMIRLMDAD